VFIGIRKGCGYFSDMARKSGQNRRASTIIRHNEVHRAYAELSARLGRHLVNNKASGISMRR